MGQDIYINAALYQLELITVSGLPLESCKLLSYFSFPYASPECDRDLDIRIESIYRTNFSECQDPVYISGHHIDHILDRRRLKMTEESLPEIPLPLQRLLAIVPGPSIYRCTNFNSI